jgi:hypothetical protein
MPPGTETFRCGSRIAQVDEAAAEKCIQDFTDSSNLHPSPKRQLAYVRHCRCADGGYLLIAGRCPRFPKWEKSYTRLPVDFSKPAVLPKCGPSGRTGASNGTAVARPTRNDL